MINTRSPLEEKMILFWHGILCTADSKLQSQAASHAELELFRTHGMGASATSCWRYPATQLWSSS